MFHYSPQRRLTIWCASISDPEQWSVEQVRAWVAYTCQQYRLAPPPLDWLTVDGRTLCSLSEQQFSMYGQVSEWVDPLSVAVPGAAARLDWKSRVGRSPEPLR